MSGVLVSGWFGNGNLGDEAVLAGMRKAFRQTLPLASVAALSDDPDRTAREHGIPAIGRDKRSPRRRLLSELRATLRFDALVIGGGGLVKDYGTAPGNVHAWVRPGLFARRLGQRTMWYAIGVDELRFDESARIARRAAERVAVLTVRDEGSARRLRAVGVEREPVVTADPALLLETPNGSDGGERVVAVCPREWKAAADEVAEPQLQRRLWDELAGALDALVETEDATILFVPFGAAAKADDAAVCRAIRDRMRHPESAPIAPVPPTPQAAVATLRGCELVIGTRLHSLILAAAAGVPFHAFDYMPKVGYFAERTGLEEECSRLEVAREGGALERRLHDTWLRRHGLRDRIARVVPLLQRLARLDAELLAELLAGGRRIDALEGEGRRLQRQVVALRAS